MRVLVACEESQAVVTQFRSRGHEAYSCDLCRPSGGHPEWHIIGDAQRLVNGNCDFYTMDGEHHSLRGGVRWDLLIAFPPCTYLTNAGANRLFRDEHDGEFQMVNVERLKKGIKARDFFLSMLGADCKHIAVENPVPSTIFCMPEATQTIQPFQFGHPYTKRTCLWLKNLPLLRPTEQVEPKCGWVNGGNRRADGSLRVKQGENRNATVRSKTFDGVAMAMAEQWSDIERYRDDEQPELF